MDQEFLFDFLQNNLSHKTNLLRQRNSEVLVLLDNLRQCILEIVILLLQMIIHSPLHPSLVVDLLLLKLAYYLGEAVVIQLQSLNLRIQDVDSIVSFIDLVEIKCTVLF